MNFRIGLVAIILLLIAQGANAASRWVYMSKAMDDSAIIVSENGDAFQIEKINSPGLFSGVGSERILPGIDQKCIIWDSSWLGSLDGLITPTQGQPNHGTSGCEAGHFILSITANGDIIQLEDGSIWRVDDIDMVTSIIWQLLSNITICGSHLINTDTGEKVRATRLK